VTRAGSLPAGRARRRPRPAVVPAEVDQAHGWAAATPASSRPDVERFVDRPVGAGPRWRPQRACRPVAGHPHGGGGQLAPVATTRPAALAHLRVVALLRDVPGCRSRRAAGLSGRLRPGSPARLVSSRSAAAMSRPRAREARHAQADVPPPGRQLLWSGRSCRRWRPRTSPGRPSSRPPSGRHLGAPCRRRAAAPRRPGRQGQPARRAVRAWAGSCDRRTGSAPCPRIASPARGAAHGQRLRPGLGRTTIRRSTPGSIQKWARNRVIRHQHQERRPGQGPSRRVAQQRVEVGCTESTAAGRSSPASAPGPAPSPVQHPGRPVQQAQQRHQVLRAPLRSSCCRSPRSTGGRSAGAGRTRRASRRGCGQQAEGGASLGGRQQRVTALRCPPPAR